MPEPISRSPTSATGVYLCFDFGLRKTGVAVGQAITRTASPIGLIEYPHGQVDYPAISALISQWRPESLIVGLPLTEDGSSQAMTEQATAFGAALEQRFGLAVHFADERFTSRAARDRHRQRRQAGTARRRDAAKEDAVAAQIILENWLIDEAP